MDNKTIYKKTLGFSLRRALWDIISFLIIGGLAVVGFIVAEKVADSGLVGLFIGVIIGFVILALISRFISYILKAGQIAMMTRAVTEGNLPDDVVKEGKRVVKERFLTVAAYFAVTKTIKAIFNQIGHGITKVGQNIGGDVGGTIGSAINSAIQTVISYLSDCCLGWVFYRKEVNAAKATCEGAALFFKHGKTLAKNMGRIFGIGLLSFVLIAGVFGGATYLILSAQGTALDPLYNEIAQVFAESEGTFANILQNPATIPLALSVIVGAIVWGIIHSTFIRPFVLAGVLKNYLESGMQDIPTEESYAKLEKISPKFAKLRSEL